MGVEVKATQSKRIYIIFNRVIAENFPKFKKQRVTQVQDDYRTANHFKKSNTPQEHHNQHT
jgi:hypothetical protein